MRSGHVLGLAALAGLAAIAATQPTRPVHRSRLTARHKAARRTDWGAALLALSALTDSGIEHYRGSFHNKAMYAPLAISSLTFATSLRDALAPTPERHPFAETIDYLALGTGLVGTGFHLYNITKRPGGFSWLNLFYSAPIGAPAALSLAGMLRRMGEHLRRGTPELGHLPTPRAMAALLALGLLGTTAEAGLLHFRGAYQDPAMFIPVTLPPVVAALLANAAARPGRRHPITRWALRLLTGVGFLGAGFHVYGVSRNMGGWSNWSQNVLNGPPIPAPPSFTALAIAGLAALDMIERGEA
jgi:hypothetical protein